MDTKASTRCTKLKEQAKIPVHYKVYADKTVKVVIDDKEVVYTGTIHSVNCSGNALSNGRHPYQCSHCYSLVHGNNSSLLRKFNRAKSLKYLTQQEPLKLVLHISVVLLVTLKVPYMSNL